MKAQRWEVSNASECVCVCVYNGVNYYALLGTDPKSIQCNQSAPTIVPSGWIERSIYH